MTLCGIDRVATGKSRVYSSASGESSRYTRCNEAPLKFALFRLLLTLAYLSSCTACYLFLFDHALKKNPKYRRHQIRGELRESLITLFVLSLFSASIFTAQALGYGTCYDFWSGFVPFWYELAQFPLAVLLADGGIYWLHRMMHRPVMFRWFHRQHHRYIIPTPFSAYAFHPLEACILSAPVFMYSFILPMSRLAQTTILVYSNILTVLDRTYIGPANRHHGKRHLCILIGYYR
ncbi:putative Delta(7)-sterol 5(6)-desaturase [Beauveria bassiana]|nr:putative Delta(7)-sterol 5(6)-desaturase [Beauveria bassiana]